MKRTAAGSTSPTRPIFRMDGSSTLVRSCIEVSLGVPRAVSLRSQGLTRPSSKVISFGFVLNLPRTPRSFPPSYLERLKADNLHPSLLGKLLKAAHPPIQLSNGETLEHPGWETGSKIVVLGDTSDASGVRELATGADL